MNYQIPAIKLDLVLIKKKRTCHVDEFTIPADHSMKMKES